jgi:hypothetical protein
MCMAIGLVWFILTSNVFINNAINCQRCSAMLVCSEWLHPEFQCTLSLYLGGISFQVTEYGPQVFYPRATSSQHTIYINIQEWLHLRYLNCTPHNSGRTSPLVSMYSLYSGNTSFTVHYCLIQSELQSWVVHHELHTTVVLSRNIIQSFRYTIVLLRSKFNQVLYSGGTSSPATGYTIAVFRRNIIPSYTIYQCCIQEEHHLDLTCTLLLNLGGN